MKRIGKDEDIHLPHLATAGLPGLLIALFFVVGFLSLFPLRQALVLVGVIIVAGVLGATVLLLLRRKRPKPVLNIPDPSAAEPPPPPIRPT